MSIYVGTNVPCDDDDPYLEEWIAEFCTTLTSLQKSALWYSSFDVMLLYDLGKSPRDAAQHIEEHTHVL